MGKSWKVGRVHSIVHSQRKPKDRKEEKHKIITEETCSCTTSTTELKVFVINNN